jgi:hypothetical protein
MNLESALRSVNKKYECDICGEEFSRHEQAVKHAAKCEKYSIEEDPTVRKVSS